MSRFIFITHLTPKNKRSALREALNDCYFHSLESQTCQNWKAIIIGEEEKQEGRYHFFRLTSEERNARFAELKNLLLRADVRAMFDEADYVVKLDDDDLISPAILAEIDGRDFDCCYDRFHTFYDISSGQLTQQQRPWIASTCIHRREHALALYDGPGASPVGNLLYSDHSKSWHNYYKDKKNVITEPAHPVYLRVLSPTSITSGAKNGPPMRLTDIDLKKYHTYLRSFGYWQPAAVQDFDRYKPMLRKAWVEFAGTDQQPIPGMGMLSCMTDKIKRLCRIK